MGLKEYREEIDAIDKQMVDLFQQRMHVAEGIVRIKQQEGRPILDAGREAEKLQQIRELAHDDMAEYCALLYHKILELSRDYQAQLMNRE